MRGKAKFKNQSINPDEKWQSQKVTKFINYAMVNGKKSVAKKIVEQAIADAAKNIKAEPLEVFEKAIENASPLLEVRPRRIGGATYLVPMEVNPKRRLALSMKAVLAAAINKKGKPMARILAQELVNAYNNEGDAIARRNELHKLAESNKAFAHYAKF